MRRLWNWLMEPTRRPYFVILAAMVVVGVGVYGVRWEVDRLAHKAGAAAATKVQPKINASAATAATIAARKVNMALAKTQHDAEERDFLQKRGACRRNNALRAHIQANTGFERELGAALAVSRDQAATLERNPALAVHDRAQAVKYRALLKTLKDTPQIDCVAKYPDPFAKPTHH